MNHTVKSFCKMSCKETVKFIFTVKFVF